MTTPDERRYAPGVALTFTLACAFAAGCGPSLPSATDVATASGNADPECTISLDASTCCFVHKATLPTCSASP